MSTDTPEDPTETAAFQRTCEELLERILAGDVGRADLEEAKLQVCGEHSSPKVPRNSEILDRAPPEDREAVESVVRRKPVRTASGVTPVAIMTSPHGCPHGKCLYCPGGPSSEFSSAQSYTGHEPAAARGKQNDYDPYGQVTLRLEQLREIGHPVDKVELILMGGTMTARSHDYQEWFVKRALAALNQYDLESEPEPAEDVSFAPGADGGQAPEADGGQASGADGGQAPEADSNRSPIADYRYLEDVLTANETADVRNVSTTFETKPDWCDPEQIDRMLRLGGTKVEIGVQTTYERINREMHRGHGIQASIDANRRLRDAAFKVGFHTMPGQPGMSREMCREDFRRIFERSEYRPDYLKIYPTLVVEGTAAYDMHHRGEYEPLDNDEAAELVADIKSELPRYTRLQRVQRDIPADFIEAGVWKSNLRQLARRRLTERGERCECIRCREVGMNDESPETVELDVIRYEAGGGTERFISFEDFEKDLLVGFCRLRFPDDPVRRELEDAALVRELHVYGSEVGVGEAANDGTEDGGRSTEQHQHRGYGRRLLAEAEALARDAGYGKLSVISGIGVRQYYRQKLDYFQDGPYVSKVLD